MEKRLLLALCALLAVACAAEEDAAAADGAGGQGGEAASGGAGGSGGSGGSGGAGGAGGAAVDPCVTDVPCESDLQCSSLPGHVCQTDVALPVCVKLRCSEAGGSCTNDDHCAESNVCRDLEHDGAQRCSDADVFPLDDCLRSCATSTRDWLEYEGWDEQCGPVFELGCQVLCTQQEAVVCGGWGVRDIWYARCERTTQPLSIVFSVNCLYSSDQYTHRGQ